MSLWSTNMSTSFWGEKVPPQWQLLYPFSWECCTLQRKEKWMRKDAYLCNVSGPLEVEDLDRWVKMWNLGFVSQGFCRVLSRWKDGGGKSQTWRWKCDDPGLFCLYPDSVNEWVAPWTKTRPSILQQHAIPSGIRLAGQGFILQQDNEPKHTFRRWRNHHAGMALQSLDLVSIELLWDHWTENSTSTNTYENFCNNAGKNFPKNGKSVAQNK